MNEERITMTEMEELLAKDMDGSYKDQVLDKLKAVSTELKHKMDSGLPPEEFEQTEKIRHAVELASSVIEQTWQQFQANG